MMVHSKLAYSKWLKDPYCLYYFRHNIIQNQNNMTFYSCKTSHVINMFCRVVWEGGNDRDNWITQRWGMKESVGLKPMKAKWRCDIWGIRSQPSVKSPWELINTQYRYRHSFFPTSVQICLYMSLSLYCLWILPFYFNGDEWKRIAD